MLFDLLLGLSNESVVRRIALGLPAPDVALLDADGGAVSIGGTRGRVA